MFTRLPLYCFSSALSVLMQGLMYFISNAVLCFNMYQISPPTLFLVKTGSPHFAQYCVICKTSVSELCPQFAQFLRDHETVPSEGTTLIHTSFSQHLTTCLLLLFIHTFCQINLEIRQVKRMEFYNNSQRLIGG